jgi:HAMP domain-containing protein
MKFFYRFSLGAQFAALLVLFLAVIGVAVVVVGQSIVVSQTVNECRSVADMAEHIGKWASQYGGMHAKTTGPNSPLPGTYLLRAVYAANPSDKSQLAGSQVSDFSDALAALSRADSYYWKNPALIQREISDIAAVSPSKAKFRITAKSVLNKNNAPTEFEAEAIGVIADQFADRAQASVDAPSTPEKLEYWKVERGHVLYSRALIASSSCLKCHGTPDTAPAFLRANDQFNGGGGFGYEVGKPAGIISVSIPLPKPEAALAESLTPQSWAALAAVGLVGLLMLIFITRRIIVPVNQLRAFADALAGSQLNASFKVPEFGEGLRGSRNEVHRLACTIENLGKSVKVLFDKLKASRA